MIKTTKALRKIASLKKRIWCIQGGQGAGKTFSILILIINFAFKNEKKEIYIASAELSKMRDTVLKDFIKIIQLMNIPCEITGVKNGPPLAVFKNGSFVRFLGLDKDDIGKGLRSDLVFLNEANKTNFETYRELTSRAKRIILDYNPNKKFWAHTEVIPRSDCQYLQLTFKDNEYLSAEERNEILRYKEKGYDINDSIISEYWANMWRVYGLGITGSVEGRVFHWKPIPYKDYLSIEAPRIITVDWGKVDPWAIGEMKYKDGKLYNHELNHDSEDKLMREMPEKVRQMLKNGEQDGIVSYMFNKLNISKDDIIVCDNNRKSKIIQLRHAGWERAIGIDASSKQILDGVSLLQNMDVYYTDTSKNIEFEQEVYAYEKDKDNDFTEKFVDADNHQIDRIRYGAKFWEKKGLIRVA